MPTAAIIGLVLEALEQGIPYVEKLITTAKQKGELTPAQEAEFDARVTAIQNPLLKPEYWKTDQERGV